MKLSEKGWDKVLDEALYFDEDIANESLEWSNDKQEYKLRHMEFEPDDFEGVVCLTLEEAKGLLEISRDYRMYLFEHCRIPLSLSVNEAFTALRERIEQAEGKR